ncbi:FadR/GntR family transcriptional regulator [Bacillus sp. FJAT-29814]|uniref:FadR/GntR family transcriptional regulator n=1 Tax=Bacillus sp. FJAT-29814 TaxID=1729688 RepID=UPI00082E45AF|nr:FadR/GntR family transcriptional regulator [Bacillus sp. FJAT-29814]
MKSLKKVTLHERVVEAIQLYIKEMNMMKGDKLPSVKEMTEKLNVSHSSLREGLRVLEANDMIEVINGKGIFVKDTSLRFEAKIEVENEKALLLNVIEVRRLLEGKAIELAAIRATEEELEQMEKYLSEAIRLSDLGMESSKEDWSFHKMIYQASHNPVLESVAESVSTIFNKLWSRPFGIDKIFEDTYPLHQMLFEEIKRRNPKKALQEFHKMIDMTEETIKKI